MACNILGAAAMALWCYSSCATVPANSRFPPLIERSISALGGREAIERIKSVRWRGGEVSFGNATAVGVFTRGYVEFPDKFRHESWEGPDKLMFAEGGNKTELWKEVDGKVVPLGGPGGQSKESAWPSRCILAWAVVTKDKRISINLDDEIQVKGRAAIGCRVSRPGYVEMRLYFDKETALPVKGEYMLYDPLSGRKQKWEEYYSEYKKTRNVLVPRRMIGYFGGKKTLSYEITEIELLEGPLDYKLFQKPKL